MDKNLQHSINYITSKTGGKSKFSVPKNYFDGIEDDVLTKISEVNLPNKELFTVPKDYFTNLEDEILAKISPEDNIQPKKEVKVISLQKRILQVIPYTVAASVVLFIGTYFFNNYNNSTVTLDDITVAEIENWYNNGYGDSNETELAMTLETVDFTDDELSSIQLNDAVLEDYFNSKDNTLLLNEIQ